jgi:four helix bundle protein
MRAYRLACELVTESWEDAEKLTHHRTTEKVSGQLYAAVGSIAANLGEGYAHSSGKDRARIFEYALGSARESIAWFHSAEPVLGPRLWLSEWRNSTKSAGSCSPSSPANAAD